MLKKANAFSSFSVPDIEKAKQFYGETLGLEVSATPEGLRVRLAGGNDIFVYHSDSNKPAEFTILNFIVDDVEKTVEALVAKGVSMEHYDMPGIQTDEKGIARGEQGPRAMAWFKDSAGNILAVMQEK